MSLFEPGSARSGPVFTDAAWLHALVRVESAWLVVRGHAGLDALDTPGLLDAIAPAGEQAGNPVVPLVAELRRRLHEDGDDEQAEAVHRGLTSQDVVDTALALCSREAADAAGDHIARAVARLRGLADEHRSSLRCGRTLTQPAVPTTFGAVVSTWLHALLDAVGDLATSASAIPVQAGGAAGTLAGPLTQVDEPVASLGNALGLPPGPPWHVNRAPVTRFGDALVRLHDACGLIADDVLVGSRPEIGELAEGTGGGSSTMPHKHNPVLSVLVRSSAIAAPGLGSTLHAAAAAQVDQRAAGGWHAEWPALSRLARSAVATASRTADVLDGLVVDAARMRANAEARADDLLAEARALDASAAGLEDYLGACAALTDEAIARADTFASGAKEGAR